MFDALIASKATAAIELFAQQARKELDVGKVPAETRQWLVTLLDNACVRYAYVRQDRTTATIISMVRPRLKTWLL